MDDIKQYLGDALRLLYKRYPRTKISVNIISKEEDVFTAHALINIKDTYFDTAIEAKSNSVDEDIAKYSALRDALLYFGIPENLNNSELHEIGDIGLFGFLLNKIIRRSK